MDKVTYAVRRKGYKCWLWFTRQTPTTGDWSRYIGDALCYARRSTWDQWECVRSGEWEVVPLVGNPREIGLNALIRGREISA